MKPGDIVYLKDVGFPFDGTGFGSGANESWEGASCRVSRLNAGAHRDMVEVESLFPIGGMHFALFFPNQVKLETRVWLKKNVGRIILARKTLDTAIQTLQDLRSCDSA